MLKYIFTGNVPFYTECSNSLYSLNVYILNSFPISTGSSGNDNVDYRFTKN
jgi:hypothetical protein